MKFIIIIFMLLLFVSCSNNSIPKIDPTILNVGGYVCTKSEYVNDPIKNGDFGDWELLHHLNYYYADNYKGKISPSYYIMFVNIAGFETEDFGIAAGPDDDSRFTNSGGKIWTKANGGEVYCRFGLDIVNEKIAWNNGNGGIKYSLNSGKTWNTVTPIQCLPHIAFFNEDTGWIASSFHMFSTINRGETFQEMKLPNGCSGISAISRRNENTGYILDKKGILYITKDLGRTWTSSSIGLKNDEELQSSNHIRAAVRFTDDLNGRIVYSQNGSVWSLITSDGGKVWNKKEIPAVKNRNRLLSIYLSRNSEILTITSMFEDRNESFVLKYKD